MKKNVLIFKKKNGLLTLKLMTFFVILFVVSCEKNSVDNGIDHRTTKAINEEIFSDFPAPFAVENNTLIFSSEEDFQKAIDFLNTLNLKDLYIWDSYCGFNSLLNSSNFECVKENPDKLFASLLNEDSEIIVGDYKFSLDFDKENVRVDYYMKNKVNTGLSKSTDMEFGVYNFEDDIFTILENENKDTKATYCGGRDDASVIPLEGIGDYVGCRVRYYTVGIYNTISIRMEEIYPSGFDTYSGLILGCYTNYGESVWENKKESGNFNNISENRTSPNADITIRPYARTRRLKSFYLNVEFYTTCSWNQLNTADRVVDINCH